MFLYIKEVGAIEGSDWSKKFDSLCPTAFTRLVLDINFDIITFLYDPSSLNLLKLYSPPHLKTIITNTTPLNLL